MQFAKDTFYIALRERLIALNPQRVVLINGVNRSALIVTENEANGAAEMLPDAFYLEWGAFRIIEQHAAGNRPLLGIDCAISYGSRGTCESGVDRGRTLAALDTELLGICHPPTTRKRDFTQSPSADLGTNIFWSRPQLLELSGKAFGSMRAGGSAAELLKHHARLTVFFFPEVELS